MARRTKTGYRDPGDWHLWNEVARSVSPLPRKMIIFPAPAKMGETALKKKLASATGIKNGGIKNNGVRTSTTKYYSPPWSPGQADTKAAGEAASMIDPRIHRRVRRGQVPIDASIDLHGMRQEEARAALYRFIPTRAERGDRTLLVITGKGLKKTGFGAIAERGILRHMLPRWLGEPQLQPFIAGWEVSARHHGGEGAFYVRLKMLRS